MNGLSIFLITPSSAEAKNWISMNSQWLRSDADSLWFAIRDDPEYGLQFVENLDDVILYGRPPSMVAREMLQGLHAEIGQRWPENDILIAKQFSLARADWRDVVVRAQQYATPLAVAGRWLVTDRRSSQRLLIDQMPARIAMQIRNWSFSPHMHGVVAARLPNEFLWISHHEATCFLTAFEACGSPEKACEYFFDLMSAEMRAPCLYLPDIVVHDTR